MKEYCSFVKKENFRSIRDQQEFDAVLDECRKTHRPLENLDLSSLDLRNIDLGELLIRNVIFNTFKDNNEERKTIFNVNFKGSILNNVCFAQCRMVRCNFDMLRTTRREVEKFHLSEAATERPTIIRYSDFFFTEFDTCRFRSTKIDIADFRYSRFLDCTLGDWNVYVGDFYMASFCGTTNLDRSEFRSCSLTNAVFENNCPNIRYIHRLAQEDYPVYRDIIIGYDNWSKHNPCAGFSHVNEGEDIKDSLKSRIHNHHEAYRVYASLSGIYNGKGLFRESNLAYGRAKNNEFKYYCLSFKSSLKPFKLWNLLKCLWHIITISVSWLFGYGYKVGWVICIFLAIVITGGYIFYKDWTTNPNKTAEMSEPNICDALAHSLNNSLGPHSVVGDKIGLLGASFETVIGILLVGFLGFILANRIRNNA